MIKVLFAHSDQKLMELYRPRLAHHFSVDRAFDGLSALRMLKLSKPGLVVSGYDLPFLSGLGLLKFVRRKAAYAATPFIFLASNDNMLHALSCGANDWLDLAKSSPDMLIEKIYGQLKVNRYGL